MQKTSHNGTNPRDSKKGERKVISIVSPVADHLDSFLVHAQSKDVAEGLPLKQKQDYYTEAMKDGMAAQGYKLPDSEREEVQQ